MKYQRLTFLVTGKEQAEILSALLFEDGFEGLEEQRQNILAYREASEQELPGNEVLNYCEEHSITYSSEIMEDTNWNSIWEAQFEPILVDEQCFIGAQHHKVSTVFPFVITIQPQMSFGTGHHPTTYLMVSEILKNTFLDSHVLDFGSGTGILAILAELKGAKTITAIDIDPNAFDNIKTNIKLNNCTKITALKGDIEKIPKESSNYQYILANITKNVITERLSTLNKHLVSGGTLICSGFFGTDIPYFKELIKNKEFQNLEINHTSEKEEWACIKIKKL